MGPPGMFSKRQRDGILVQMLTEARVEEMGKWRQESYLGGGISKCRWLVRKEGQRDLPGGNLGGRWWVWARGVCVCVLFKGGRPTGVEYIGLDGA